MQYVNEESASNGKEFIQRGQLIARDRPDDLQVSMRNIRISILLCN